MVSGNTATEEARVSAAKSYGLRLVYTTALLVLYSIIFCAVYKEYLASDYGYLGFRNNGSPNGDYLITSSAIFFIIFLLPKTVSDAGSFLLWEVFVLAYIPIQLTLVLSGSIGPNLCWTTLSLCASMSIACLNDTYFPLREINISNFFGKNFLHVFELFVFSVAVILVLYFWPIMSLASVEGIYEQRAAAAEYSNNKIFIYLISWMTYGIIPLFYAIAFETRKYKYFFYAIFLSALIYSITAAKLLVFLFGMAFFIYGIMRTFGRSFPFLFLVMPIIVLGSAQIIFICVEDFYGSQLYFPVSQFVVRGIGIQGMLFNAYAEFFSANPNTYYSHLTGINLFLSYPYDEPLGHLINIHLRGNTKAYANSGMWATEGIAAAGNIGIIIVGFLFGLVCKYFSVCTKSINTRFSCIAFAGIAMMLINVPLPTVLITGGGLIFPLVVQLIAKNLTLTGMDN